MMAMSRLRFWGGREIEIVFAAKLELLPCSGVDRAERQAARRRCFPKLRVFVVGIAVPEHGAHVDGAHFDGIALLVILLAIWTVFVLRLMAALDLFNEKFCTHCHGILR